MCAGVRRALEAGVEAVHLEEPEYWVEDGYSEAFKREWQQFYGEPWQPPHLSVDAQWRASNLKYFLYRRALQQVFNSVLAYNKETGRHVRCYVPTHSLLNYASWRIVSPESSLARLDGCDGYIAQVWTGTSRTPNTYHGQERERTFETAFLEYGAMQNLVRATHRSVWYLNDPIEDNPDHGWDDYQRNWECTLTASLFQPDVSHYEVAPWPERIFNHRYPRNGPEEKRRVMPPAYATELQTVWNALDNMAQSNVTWDCGSTGIGVLISDSLMFERGDPSPSDSHLNHIYGLALPFLKRGMPVQPVQLEDVGLPGCLDSYKCLLLTYQGMKPLSADVHRPIVDWVKKGGILVVCDDDSDPFNTVREWWNTNGMHCATPRQHLFDQLGILNEGLKVNEGPFSFHVGNGEVIWIHNNPADLAASADGDKVLVDTVREVVGKGQHAFHWNETNDLLLRRGPYVIAAGLDESIEGPARTLHGRFVNLFDAELKLQKDVTLSPGMRFVLLDVDAPEIKHHSLLAAACGAVLQKQSSDEISYVIEGVENTSGIALFKVPRAPRTVQLAEKTLDAIHCDTEQGLLWVRFTNTAAPRTLSLQF